MNIECVKDKLSYAISKVEKITTKNISLPILGCILLEAKDSNLIIRATNLDLGIEISIPVKVIKPGKVAVSGVVLYNFLLNINNDKNVSLEEKDGNLKISTKHLESIIKSFPVDDFPNIPKVENNTSFSFNAPNLIKGLKSVMYSSSISTIRPTLSSVLVLSEEDEVVFVATDSFRLAEKKIGVNKHKDFSQILIPVKNINEIIRILEDTKDDVEVFLNENQIAFVFEDTYLTSRVIDGVFPDYKQIIPKETKTEVVLLKQDFVSSLKISNIFADKFSQVVLNISPKNKSFKISTKNIDIGENTSNLDSVLKGEDLTISFNYKYIVDCFQSINTDSISLSFSGTGKPVVVRGVGDKSFLYLVMPMNK